MDARERLLRYLEQRRELGESEFVLDDLSVEQAMRLLGVRGALPTVSRTEEAPPPAGRPAAPRGRAAAVTDAPPPMMRRSRDETASVDVDWRAALREAGVAPPSAESPPRPKRDDAPVPSDRAQALVVGSDAAVISGPLAQADSLEAVATLIQACTACGLHAVAKQAVPGAGNPQADLVVVGEAPGAEEDEQGLPFVGRSGDLLTKILAAVDLPRDQIFICNVIKHRPPANRNPVPDEVAACVPFLLRQLAIIRPKVILALGKYAAQSLLQTTRSIGELRGHEHSYYGVPLVVTYHPAALLRNPAWKRPTWDDVQFARRLLDRARRDA